MTKEISSSLLLTDLSGGDGEKRNSSVLHLCKAPFPPMTTGHWDGQTVASPVVLLRLTAAGSNREVYRTDVPFFVFITPKWPNHLQMRNKGSALHSVILNEDLECWSGRKSTLPLEVWYSVDSNH